MGFKSKEGNIDLYYMDSDKKQNIRAEKKSAPKGKKKINIEKNKTRTKKEDDIFDFDTEIVLGISNKEKEEKRENKNLNNKNNKDKKKTNNLRKINKAKIILFIMKWTILIGILVAAIIFLLTTPIFNTKEIQVMGNSKISTDEIISLSQLKLEENIFNNRKSSIINAIKENPYVESVRVNRKMPNVIELKITERQPSYCIQILNSYAYIDKQGFILEISEQKPEHPLLKGLKATEQEIIAGSRLCDEDLEKLPTLFKIMEASKEVEIHNLISQIDLTNQYQITLHLESKNKTVHLGDISNLSNKMLYVKAILDAEEGNSGEIFVNGNLNDAFQPFFREKV